jgi:RNA polymerase sigma-70 factor (ECF subfamily)
LSLLERARARDPQAWQRLVSLYLPLVYGWCRQAGLAAVDAEEVGQEVLLKVNTGLANFRRDRPGDSFRGWLRTITANKIRDHRRSHPPQRDAEGGSDAQARLKQLPADDPSDSAGPTDAAGASADERKALLGRALDQVRPTFKETTWQAFWRVVVDGQLAELVAGQLGMSTNAVHLAKGRVLRRFRAEFKDLLEFSPPR